VALKSPEVLICNFSGKQITQDEAIFLTSSPDGVLIIDLNRDLPAKHICFECKRVVLEASIKQGILAEFFGSNLKIPTDFVEKAHVLLKNKAINMLCLARKSGVLVFGFEKVLSAVNASEAEFLLHAIDGKEDGKQKTALNAGAIRIFSVFNAKELGGVIGRERIVHIAVLKGNVKMSLRLASLIVKVQAF